MRGGERAGSRQTPRVALSVGAIDGVGRAARVILMGGVGYVGCIVGVEVTGGVACSEVVVACDVCCGEGAVA